MEKGDTASISDRRPDNNKDFIGVVQAIEEGSGQKENLLKCLRESLIWTRPVRRDRLSPDFFISSGGAR